MLASPTNPQDPIQRHLNLFLEDVASQIAVPTLRSFLKLYTSLDVAKLAGFLDIEEEEMVSMMMVMKNASRSIVHRGGAGSGAAAEKALGLLDGEMISTSDLNFVINEVCPLLSVRGCHLTRRHHR